MALTGAPLTGATKMCVTFATGWLTCIGETGVIQQFAGLPATRSEKFLNCRFGWENRQLQVLEDRLISHKRVL